MNKIRRLLDYPTPSANVYGSSDASLHCGSTFDAIELSFTPNRMVSKELSMIICRQAPSRDFKREVRADSEVYPLDVAFKRNDEYCQYDDLPNGRVEVNVGSSVINGESTDRHRLVMSPSEVMLLFATLPADEIAEAARQFFETVHRYGFERGNPDLHEPDCAITKKEFADKLIELFRAMLDSQ